VGRADSLPFDIVPALGKFVKDSSEIKFAASWSFWAVEQAGNVFDDCKLGLQFIDGGKDCGETVSTVFGSESISVIAEGLAGRACGNDADSSVSELTCPKVHGFDIAKSFAVGESSSENGLAVFIPLAEDVGATSPQFDSGIGEANPDS
jgi:hypothetical protein